MKETLALVSVGVKRIGMLLTIWDWRVGWWALDRGDDEMIAPHDDLDSAETLGWEEFTAHASLCDAVTLNAPAPAEGVSRGWWLAYALHYAQGFAFAASRFNDAEIANATNPHPQFSPAWEAWASGFEACLDDA